MCGKTHQLKIIGVHFVFLNVFRVAAPTFYTTRLELFSLMFCPYHYTCGVPLAFAQSCSLPLVCL